jgi:hypothetical protein
VNENNHYAHHFKNSGGKFFSQAFEGKWVAASDFRRNIHCTGNRHTHMHTYVVQKLNLKLHFSQIPRVAMPIFFFFFSLDMFKSIYTFLHFINISKDRFQEPLKPFKIYPITGHPNSKFQTLILTPIKHFKW